EDYAVIVLDQRLGDQLGWMGAMNYTEDWDDVGYFFNVGYPNDLMGGVWPFVQSGVAFEDADNPGFYDTGEGLDMETESASITDGMSGGPFFHWWSDNWPYVVGVVSGMGLLEGDADNWAGGGYPMLNLIHRALSEWP